MIPDAKMIAWNTEVTDAANRHGWTVYSQIYRNQRQPDPSIVLVLGRRVILAYLRATVRRDRSRPAARFDGAAGLETYVWTPADWPQIQALLVTGHLDQPTTSRADP